MAFSIRSNVTVSENIGDRFLLVISDVAIRYGKRLLYPAQSAISGVTPLRSSEVHREVGGAS